MEKTLQEQYNLIKEGKGNKAHFLKTALRQFPSSAAKSWANKDTTDDKKFRSVAALRKGLVPSDVCCTQVDRRCVFVTVLRLRPS